MKRLCNFNNNNKVNNRNVKIGDLKKNLSLFKIIYVVGSNYLSIYDLICFFVCVIIGYFEFFLEGSRL